MKKIIIAISMMLAMNIFLAVPALAENYQEYGLYDSDGNFVSSNDYGNSKSQIRGDGYLYLTLCDIDGETNKAEYMNIIPDTAYISNLVSELDSRISALEAK